MQNQINSPATEQGTVPVVTVGDLKKQIGLPFPRPMLYCAWCGQESSANRGDYFNQPLSHVFTCCDEPMQLVVKRVSFERVTP